MVDSIPTLQYPESSPQSIIHDAFKKLEQALHHSDIRLFQSTTLKDVREAAKIISRDQAQRRCLQNLRRIEPFFEALGKFGGAIETLCQGTPYLCFIWVQDDVPCPKTYELTAYKGASEVVAADEYLQGFTQLLDAYEQIAEHLPRFGRLGAVFHDKPEFHSILADVYADILEFHLHAYKFLRRGGWKHLFDASWRNFGSRFNAILQSLARNRDLVDKEANSFDILESKAFRHRLYADIERREAETRDWQLRDTLTWLDLHGQDREQEELFESRSKARLDGTCEWILRNPKIFLWLDEHDRRLFVWLRGKPGSGKTTLAAYLKEEAPLPPWSIILYCLCSYGFNKQESSACSLVFRSLIGQLLRNRADLLPHVYDNYVKVGAVPKLGKTKNLLKNLLRCLEITYILLDGLDEFLADSEAKLSPPKVKILVCSRDTRDIARKLNKAPQISLTSEDRHVSQDIAFFTNNSLAELKDRFDDTIVEEIGNAVVKKAEGMFLWVHLVLTTIVDQESVQDLRRAIDRLPAGLPGVYENILTRLRSHGDEHQRLRAERILGWLAFACRPLKAWEICDGLVFHEGEALNDETKLGAGVLDICKPLIEERESGTIALVHFSAREYLLHRMSGPYISHFRVQADMTIACLRYLLTCIPLIAGAASVSTHGHIIKGFHDIFPYVHEFWLDHLLKYNEALRAHPDDEKRVQMVQDLLSTFSSSQSRSAPKALDPGSSAAVIENPSLGTESDALRALPPAVRRYIAYRKNMPAKQTSSAKEMDSNSDLARTDPTWISAAYRNFQKAFESLLGDAYTLDYHQMSAKYYQMTVTSEDVQKFKIRHSKSAYLCRWSGCVWASAGFQSTAERDKHETTHKQQFRCSDPSCDFARNGFASRQALRRHNLNYHSRVEDLVLPAFPVPGRAASTQQASPLPGGHLRLINPMLVQTSSTAPPDRSTKLDFHGLTGDDVDDFDFGSHSFGIRNTTPSTPDMTWHTDDEFSFDFQWA